MKKLVITGISRGIGLAITQLFLQKGWLVIGTSTKGSTPLVDKNLTIEAVDLVNGSEIDAFIRTLPSFDLLINNAAVLLDRSDEASIDFEKLKKTFAINVFGTIELTEKCIPKILSGGQIINITSGWGTFSSNDSPFQPHYKMSKVCLNMYTKLLAERLPEIVVSSFDPGWVKTDMGKDEAPKWPRQVAEEIDELVNRQKESGCFWFDGTKRDW